MVLPLNSSQDGYFYPLHVAAEMGHKALIILLVQVRSVVFSGLR